MMKYVYKISTRMSREYGEDVDYDVYSVYELDESSKDPYYISWVQDFDKEEEALAFCKENNEISEFANELAEELFREEN